MNMSPLGPLLQVTCGNLGLPVFACWALGVSATKSSPGVQHHRFSLPSTGAIPPVLGDLTVSSAPKDSTSVLVRVVSSSLNSIFASPTSDVHTGGTPDLS